MFPITISYYKFYSLSNEGVDVPGLVKITREYNKKYIHFNYKHDHMFYNWILNFDTEENRTLFKMKYLLSDE